MTEKELRKELPENIKVSRVALLFHKRIGVGYLICRRRLRCQRIDPKENGGTEALRSARPAVLKFMFETIVSTKLIGRVVDLADSFWRMIV